jgi:signal transduction histidine kinase
VTGNWQLLVRNRQGSLEAAVSGLRQRQLALSFGILLVLAGTMGVVVLASRRAQNLARLQMDFVAGVSHELRTPLAVISSAAENIVDGLVENKQQISRYGKVIKSQSAQLKQLVEQILLFASTRHGGQQYNLQPTDPASVVDVALENMAEVIHIAEITIEKNIEPNLPPVLIDCQALAQCLQNLITNAVKYGGDAHWLGVTAARQQGGRRNEIAITISDRGIGIEPEELKHVFDPFYRGTTVRAAQIHGSGLGLPLAKSIVEAMGGRITVESTPGRGSSFTVHLPIPTLAVAGNGLLAAAMTPKRLIENHE